MTKKKIIRLLLILTGLYYSSLGVRSFVTLYIRTGPDFISRLSLSNSILDIAIILLGIVFIINVFKTNKLGLILIKIICCISGFACLMQTLVFIMLFSREHTNLEIIDYSIGLFCCLVAFTSTIIVWKEPSILQSAA